jgi:hypothetical protein
VAPAAFCHFEKNHYFKYRIEKILALWYNLDTIALRLKVAKGDNKNEIGL